MDKSLYEDFNKAETMNRITEKMNKIRAKERFIKNYFELPEKVRERYPKVRTTLREDFENLGKRWGEASSSENMLKNFETLVDGLLKEIEKLEIIYDRIDREIEEKHKAREEADGYYEPKLLDNNSLSEEEIEQGIADFPADEIPDDYA